MKRKKNDSKQNKTANENRWMVIENLPTLK